MAGALVLLALMGTGVRAGSRPQSPGGTLHLRAPAPGQASPARTRTFPHLLTAFGPRSHPSFAPQAWRPRPGLPRGNAAWDPAAPLPPSVLRSTTRAHARSMMEARDGREFLSAYNEAKADVEPETVRVLVLRVDFLQDTPGHKSTGDGRFDLRSDEESRSLPIDPPPHDRDYFNAHMEALSRFYRVQSGGSLVLQWDVFPADSVGAYHLPDTRKYGPWIWSNSNPDVFVHAIDLVGDALAAADTSDAALDFTMARGDSLVPRYNSYLLFHAGTDIQGDINGDTPWDIPSFNLYVEDPFLVQDSTVAVNLVQVVPETANQDGFWGALNGVVAHEFGHQLGFADLYDVRTGGSVVGAFSLMDSGENLYGNIVDPADSTETLPVRGTLPGSVDPWHKVLFFPDGVDLAEPEEFLSGDSSSFTVSLPSSQLGNRILYLPLNLSEYLLVENRVWELNNDSLIVLKSDRKTGVILGPVPADTLAPSTDLGYREYDYLLPAEGIVAWHIDNLAINTGFSVDYGGVNIFYSRPGVAVLEADGIRDIGSASNEYIGGPYDTWYLGGYTCLGPETVPSSRTNDGTPTGLTMCALDSIQVTARVSVDTGLAPAGWPVVLPGAPREEQIVVLPDAGTEGSPVLVAAAGNEIYGLQSDGKPWRPGPEDAAFTFELPIEQGLAARESFGRSANGPWPALAAVAGGKLYLENLRDGVQFSWPPGAAGDSLVTATPVLDAEVVWIGCGDGYVRAIDPEAGPAPVRRVQAGAGAVRVLGVGRLHEEGAEGEEACVWATDKGEAGAAAWTGSSVTPRILFRSAESRPGVTPAGVLAIPAAGGRPARIMFAWSDGAIEWRGTDGALLPGWPASLPAAPAGSPIACDADGDGILETMAADVNGRLHCFGANGVEEFGWPRSLWSEDEQQPPPQILGVRALDLDGQGAPEIAVLRADGFLVVLDGHGKPLSGWPRALGASARLGPEWVPASSQSGTRLGFGLDYGSDAAGRSLTAVGVTRITSPARGLVEGAFPTAGFDGTRSRFYPVELMPDVSAAPVEGPRASLRLYPNPLSGDRLTVRFTLDRPARVRLTAYDLSGRQVAALDAEGSTGPDGNQLPWDLGRLTSGLYQVRVRFNGEGWSEEMLEKVAVRR